MNDGVDLSGLLNETLETLKENSQLIGIYLAVMIPVYAISAMFEPETSMGNLSPFDGPAYLQSLFPQDPIGNAVWLAATVISMIAFYWLLAGVLGRTKSPDFGRFLPFIGISFLSTLAIVGGLLLLIVPGLILAVRWMPLLPLVISREGRAMESLGESWRITEGSGWPIFGAMVIFGLVDMTVAGVVSGLSETLTPVLHAAVDVLGNVLFAAFSVAVFQLLAGQDQIRAGGPD